MKTTENGRSWVGSYQIFSLNFLKVLSAICCLTISMTNSICMAEIVRSDWVKYNLNEENHTAQVIGISGHIVTRAYPYLKDPRQVLTMYSTYNIKSTIIHEGVEYKVTSIQMLEGYEEFGNDKFERTEQSHVTINIEDGIEYIEAYAFQGRILNRNFKSLISTLSINLPSSLKSIGSNAFEGYNFSELKLTDNITSIGVSAFSGCTGFASLSLPSSVSKLGENAFQNCKDVTTLTLSNSLQTIPANAFAGCSKVTSVVIPRSVESIGSNAFSGCTALTSLTLPSWLGSINDGAFQNCSNLEEVTVGERVTSIGANAFAGCSKMSALTLSKSLISLGDGAFQDCSSLTGATIPDGVETLPDNVFNGCSKLSVLTLPKALKSIGDNAFNGCSISDGLVLPETLVSIGQSAFRNCAYTSLTLPVSVSEIGASAFADCSLLKSVTIQSGIKSLPSEGFRNCSTLTDLTIGQDMESIGALCFDRCSNLLRINSLNTVPPTASTNSFAEEAYDNAELSVASIAKDAYANAPVWRFFTHITPVYPAAESIAIEPSSLSGICGDSGQFLIKATPSDGVYSNLTWTSSDSEIISVNQDGKYTLGSKLGEATVTVTVTAGGNATQLTAFCKVNVNPTPVSTVTLATPVATVAAGKSLKLSATVGPENATDKSLLWSSSDENIVKVDSDGTVTGINVGVATVTVCSAANPEVRDTCEVTVTGREAESITLTYDDVIMRVGETLQFNVIVHPEGAVAQPVVWSTSQADVLSVDDNGLVTVHRYGNGYGYVYAKSGDLIGACYITITDDKYQLSWDQSFRCAVGDKVELTASTDSRSGVLYSSLKPNGGYREAVITEENGKQYVSFPESGTYLIEARIADSPSETVRKQFNVVESHDGLFYIDGIYYRYTDDSQISFKVVQGYETYSGDYVIPATADGIPVKEIGKQAFYTCPELGKVVIEDGIEILRYECFGNSSLSEISIPASVNIIESFAFNAITGNLRDIYLASATPIKVDGSIFNGYVNYNTCILHVPAGSVDAYRQAEVWKDFIQIKDDLSGIAMIATDGVRIHVENSDIVIEGVPENVTTDIYRLDGVQVYHKVSDGEPLTYTTLVKGIYIVVINGHAYKIAV